MLDFSIIQSLLDSNGIEAKDLAKQIGISPSVLSDWKSGRLKPPSIEKVEKIADYFNVSIDYVLGRENIPKVNNDTIEVSNLKGSIVMNENTIHPEIQKVWDAKSLHVAKTDWFDPKNTKDSYSQSMITFYQNTKDDEQCLDLFQHYGVPETLISACNKILYRLGELNKISDDVLISVGLKQALPSTPIDGKEILEAIAQLRIKVDEDISEIKERLSAIEAGFPKDASSQ